MKIIRLKSWLVVCAVVLSICTGCSSLGGKLSDSDGRFNLLKRFSSKEQEVEFKIPKSMVGIWKAATYEKVGAKSVRGFGGRFYFYDANNQPIRVDGDLTIYGYDDKNQAESGDGTADRKFVFKAESLNSHYSESAFGESYSFFVPWDNVGGELKTITLIPVFKTVDGHIPEAKPATMRLPGKRVAKTASNDTLPSVAKFGRPVVQASAEIPADQSPNGAIVSPKQKQQRARRMPTTFRLPPSLAERLSSPVQRSPEPRPNSGKESSEETQAGNFVEPPVGTETTGNRPKQTPIAERTERKKTTTVFGKPGAFQ